MITRSVVAMGTVVTIHAPAEADAAVERAFGWFFEIEARCTKFDAGSELMQLVSRPGVPVSVGPILFEAVRFAVAVAAETDGAFDPTGGHWCEVETNAGQQSITLSRPMTLDLGAVAKGMAVDAAARELRGHSHFLIDAGGDIYVAGEPWRVGVRHPRRDGELMETLLVSGQAVCTSGDYERGQHIVDPRNGQPVTGVASATVVGPTAMLCDAIATAVFVLGPEAGIALLDRLGLEGLIVTPDLARFQTQGLCNAA